VGLVVQRLRRGSARARHFRAHASPGAGDRYRHRGFAWRRESLYRRFSWRHPSIFDPQGKIPERLRLQGLPATLFLDRHHRVVAKILGETNLAGFEAGYRQALE
jgi:hypothetical protein